MATCTFEIQVDVDDEVLADHVAKSKGSAPPYERDVAEWSPIDLYHAQDEEILDLGEAQMVRAYAV